ncbi:chondroitinase-B domain-containing protein [Bowmanella dokdonensis]|uniref:Right-handed parallel beta-helix repeat-containing protein n=1 Tax=Bowmanella dokdonensis TaxID=751969 RepID=A0A939DS20_9ALTE|nr:right-handed parallel beta-helix repeat-containing protein [Bowmanella dokdonensis]MBN7827307.1 right-handed parallel beta-helix repeat-containing protein [Bowmanella dokdonensis]
MNLTAQWGVRKSLFNTAQAIIRQFPSPSPVQFDRDLSEVGARTDYNPLPVADLAMHEIVHIESESELLSALRKARPGQLLLLRRGTYRLNQHRIETGAAGTASQPIILAAGKLGDVEIHLQSTEGFYIDKSYWKIVNLTLRGTCHEQTQCDHAVHLAGNADYVALENNRFIDFNAHLKSNGKPVGQTLQFPDNVLIRHNDFLNQSIRQGGSPASPIDVVGGDNWHISDNFVADFSRMVHGRPSTVYGIYLKGGGRNGRLENNLINCAWRLPHQSSLDSRIGLSLGNGGTDPAFCQSPECAYEHSGGVISNNLILNCSNDVAIYLNKAEDTLVSNNVLLNTLGLDARFSATTVVAEYNQMHGRIKTRDGATIDAQNNRYLPLNGSLE